MADQGTYVNAGPALPYIAQGISNSYREKLWEAMKNGDLAAAQEGPGFFQKLAGGNDMWEAQQKAVQFLQNLQAAPVASELQKLKASGNSYDPNFTGDEWIKGMMTTPSLGGKMTEEQYNALRTPTVNNQVAPAMIQGAEAQAQEAADTHKVTDATMRGVAPDTGALTRFLTFGKGQMANGEKGVAGDSLYSKILAGGKQTYDIGKERQTLGRNDAFRNSLNDFIVQNPTAVADPDAWSRAVMVNASLFKPDKDIFDTAIKGVDTMFPKLELTKTFTGNAPHEEQTLAINPRTGKEVGKVGGAGVAAKDNISLTSKFEESGMKDYIAQLPKYLEGALAAQGSIGTMNKMIELIDSGAAGARGYAKATIAPMLNLLGVESKGLDDARLYQTLASTLGGSMRTDIVGPGPVSNYEQQLLKQVSGGGAMGASAAKELLTYYQEKAQTKVSTYNTMANQVSKLAPKTGGAFEALTPQPTYTSRQRNEAAKILEQRRLAAGGK